MKVDAASLAYIQNVVKTAQLVKIGNIIIEPDCVRAVDDDRTVVLFQDADVPPMPFTSIGLNRIDVFMNRFDIVKTYDKYELEAVMPDLDPEKPDAPKFARALMMSGGATKIDYRCANPATIRAPKAINDAPKYKVAMNPEAVVLMAKGQTAMGVEDVVFTGTKDGVSFEMTDTNGDTFTNEFTKDVKAIDKTNEIAFSHTYPLKIILPLLKPSSTQPIYICHKGMLKIVVNGLDMYVLPKA